MQSRMKWLAAMLVFWHGQGTLASDDYQQKLETYNQEYSQFLIEKTRWPVQIQALQDKVAQSREQYESAQVLTEQTDLLWQAAVRDLDTAQRHLEFLKQVGPVASQQQANIKSAAVIANEFALPQDVTQGSLQSKADQLQVSSTQLKNEIDGLFQDIRDIENSAPYQNLVGEKNRLVRQRNQKRQERENLSNRISRLNQEISSLEFNLQISEQRERRAQQKANQIRNIEIPRVRDQIDDTRRERQQTRQELQRKRQRIREVRQNKQQTETRIRRLEQQLNNPNADRPEIERKLREARQKLRNQNQRIQRLEREIRQLENKINELDRQESRLEDRIRNLRREAQGYDQDVSDEQDLQFDIEDDIDSKEREVARARRDLNQVDQEIASLNRQINNAQQAINDYRDIHIRPIENEIAGLQSDKNKLDNRITQLLEWKKKLNVLDNNIATAGQKITDQQAVVVEKESQVTKAKSDKDQADAGLIQLRTSLNDNIRSHNQLVQNAQAAIEKFQVMEEEVLTLKEELKNTGDEDVQ